MPYDPPPELVDKLAAIRAQHVPVPEVVDFTPFDPEFHVPRPADNPYYTRYEGMRRGQYCMEQEPAKDSARSLDLLLPMVAFQFPAPAGKEKGYCHYQGMSYCEILREIKRRRPNRRNLYEQIQKFITLPGEQTEIAYHCNPHIDLDLDLDTPFGAARDVNIAEILFEHYMKIVFDRKRAEGVAGYDFNWNDIRRSTLNGSKPDKGSRHIVYHLPGNRFFYSNLEWGNVMSEIYAECLTDLDVDACINPMFLDNPEKKNPPSIVDATVFTRNRNFRFWSCLKMKLDPNAAFFPLKPLCTLSDRDECLRRPAGDALWTCPCQRDEAMTPPRFMSYLVNYVPRNPETGEPVEEIIIRQEELPDDLLGRVTKYYDVTPRNPGIFGNRLHERKRGNGDVLYADNEGEDGAGAGKKSKKKIKKDGTDDVTLNSLASEVCNILEKMNKKMTCVRVETHQNGWAFINTDILDCEYKFKRTGTERRHNSNTLYIGVWLRKTPTVYRMCTDLDCKTWYRENGKIEMPIAEDQLTEYHALYDKYMGSHEVSNALLTEMISPPQKNIE